MSPRKTKNRGAASDAVASRSSEAAESGVAAPASRMDPVAEGIPGQFTVPGVAGGTGAAAGSIPHDERRRYDTSDPKRKPAIHQSVLGLLSKCGLAAGFQYLEKRPTKTSPSRARGTGVHEAARFALTHKMEHGTLPEQADVVSLAIEAADHELESKPLALEDEDDDPREAMEATRRQAGIAALRYLTDIAPIVEPWKVEHYVRLSTGRSFDIAGTLDVIERDARPMVLGSPLSVVRIRDLKTAKRSPSSGDVEHSMQLDFYGLVLERSEGLVVDEVALDTLVVLKREDKAVLQAAPANRNHDAMLLRIERAADVLESGKLYPADPGGPSGWACSSRYCDFFDTCPFGRARRTTHAVVTP